MVKEEGEKVSLKLNIKKKKQNKKNKTKQKNKQPTKLMASSSITSWQIEGKTVEAVMDFLLLGSKTTVDGDCSHQIGR